MPKGEAVGEFSRLASRYKELSKNEGLPTIISKGLDKILVYASAPIKKKTYANKTFQFNNKSYRYAVHSYNATWRNERAIEVPILLEYLEKNRSKRILECGNVARYYGKFSHDVIDKYEITAGIQNIDIMDYKANELYDGFIAISTFEHIGWDEPKKEPEKILKAVEHLYNLVSDKRNVLITCPLGYNAALDQYIKNDEFPFAKVLYLKRVDQENHWVECDKNSALKTKYDAKFPAANAIFVGIGLK